MAAATGTRSLGSALPTDQAAILQDLEHGAVSAAEGNEDEDPNGADSRFDYLFEEAEDEDDTYPILGLDTVQEDPALTDQDSAALLESLAHLANYEPPLLNDHDHFESLLQAAATAEVVDAAEVDLSQVCDNFALYDELDAYEYFKRNFDPVPDATDIDLDHVLDATDIDPDPVPDATEIDLVPEDTNVDPVSDTSTNKRKRDQDQDQEYEPDDDSGTSPQTPPPRRQRTVSDDDEAEQLALERELWGPPEGENEDSISRSEQQDSPVPGIDARAFGLHSATALFRRPSSASKKYTRAPMSKLFTSLELTAEQFLQMQAAAKVYMLDPDHPERRDCVGNKGKGEMDMVKLKLFACVESFLEDEGWGPRYFTDENVERSQSRKLRWPEMKNKIIQLVTPLMRRMVTNERQRLYALETRQKERSQIHSKNQARLLHIPAEGWIPVSETRRTEHLAPVQYPVVDPKLDDYPYNPDLSFHLNENRQGEEFLDPQEPEPSVPKEVGENGENAMNCSYLVNLVHDGRRVHSQVILKPDVCSGFASLVQHIHEMMSGATGGQAQQLDSVKVLGPTGLVSVSDEDSWKAAVDLVQKNEWLDGEVKCVVQVVDRVIDRVVVDLTV
ncbi:hypothetical protein WAI453_000985 [Rhynchosporium graminicola]|uniref:Uncharacterized protein n=1 Tax=Rhynchosporium graminicola TaxID=2792576 RepID=A0A1E1K9U4_9HELO|nr:uncharacterized protein RCO7_07726 [Rhynchosporium commune]